LYVFGWRDADVAIAVKVTDGNHRGALPALMAAGRELSLWVPDVWDCAQPSFGTLVAAV
jgi:hypothetical protein